MNSIETLSTRPAARRGLFNVELAAIAGALLSVADAFLNPLIILPLFAIKVDASLHAVALISAAGAASWFAALLCGSAIGRLIPQERVINVAAAIIRAGAIAWLAYGVSQSGRSNDNRLHLFFFCYVVASAAHGLSRPTGLAALSAALSGGRARWSSWFALTVGGVLSIAAGLIVRSAMGPDGPGYPKNIALVFACAAAALAAATFFISRIQAGHRTNPQRETGKALPTGIANALAAPLMRRFLVYRLALALLAGTDPFFIVYAIRGLKTPQAMAGVFLAVYAAAMLLSAPLWRKLIEQAGNRVALQLIAAIRIVAPLIALMLPNLVANKVYVDRVHNPRVESYIFAAVFGALGAAARGQSIAATTYVAEIAPERHHDAYAFLANVSLLAAGFTPLIAARIVDADGWQRLFLCATIAGLIAVFASGLLGETRAHVRSSTRALRPRHARTS